MTVWYLSNQENSEDKLQIATGTPSGRGGKSAFLLKEHAQQLNYTLVKVEVLTRFL